MIVTALAANGASAAYILDIEWDGIEEIAKHTVSFLLSFGNPY